MRSLVLPTFLHDCESWALTADLERRIQAVEMRCYHKLLGISYKDHIINEEVRGTIWQAIGPYPIGNKLAPIARLNGLSWFVSFGVSVPAILEGLRDVTFLLCTLLLCAILYFVSYFSMTFCLYSCWQCRINSKQTNKQTS